MKSVGTTSSLLNTFERLRAPEPNRWADHTRPNHDFGLGAAQTKYVICSTPRSGSTLLSRLLYATHRCGDPREYVHPTLLPSYVSRARREGFATPIELLYARRSTSNGCFGIKLHYDHMATFLRYVPVDEFITSYRFIFLRRRDLLTQALSYSRAHQAGAWHSNMQTKRTPTYDRRHIERLMHQLASDNAGWQLFLMKHGIPHLELTYEELVDDKVGRLEDAVRFIGITEPIEIDETRIDVRAQRDRRTDEWRDRFIDEHCEELMANPLLMRWVLRGQPLNGFRGLLRKVGNRVRRIVGLGD